MRCDNHFSKRPTWSRRRAPVDRLGLAPCGVYRAACVATRAVRSCRTFSPLPLRAVYFLLHFPSNGDMAPPFRPFERRTALWSPEVPPPAPNSAGSDYLGYSTYILPNNEITTGAKLRGYLRDRLLTIYAGKLKIVKQTGLCGGFFRGVFAVHRFNFHPVNGIGFGGSLR